MFGTGQSKHLEAPGTSCEASERRLAVLAGTPAPATVESIDYTPVILSPIHGRSALFRPP